MNDVINAGSAVRATFEDLEACSADIVAMGSLLTLGDAAQTFADSKHVPLESLVHLPNHLWVPADFRSVRPVFRWKISLVFAIHKWNTLVPIRSENALRFPCKAARPAL